MIFFFWFIIFIFWISCQCVKVDRSRWRWLSTVWFILAFFSAAATLSFFASSVQERLLREIFSLTSFHIQEACTPELYSFKTSWHFQKRSFTGNVLNTKHFFLGRNYTTKKKYGSIFQRIVPYKKIFFQAVTGRELFPTRKKNRQYPWENCSLKK